MFYKTCLPLVRWWWFANDLKKSEIAVQLDWIKQNNFGGVEIAWVYPQPGQPRGPQWLSAEWSDLVAFAKNYCDRLGLSCDFTFGTAWPFGGTMVAAEDASRTWHGLSPARLEKSWEEPERGYILNHLDRQALIRYGKVIGRGLEPALTGSRSGLFCDSWEVPGTILWTEGLAERFREKFGYDLCPYLPDLERHPDVRYDYRKLLSDYVLNEFYAPFSRICQELGGFSRVQCHGAPADILSAYATADVPETEAILFDPAFGIIAASAAALAGKKITSSETFTCLYGWVPYPGPAPYLKRENLADLKLLADALFASGTNLIVWHGMPYNPPGGHNEFYASVHVGPDSAFATDLPGFNRYLQDVSALLQNGITVSRAAVYLPLEDAWMRDELPEEMKKPSARYYWELHHCRIPEAIKGFRPLWINRSFLAESRIEQGTLVCGQQQFSFLWLDSRWLDHESLREILRLARQGLPVVIRQQPDCPGKNIPADYDRLRDELMARAVEIPGSSRPLVRGQDLPDFWCRRDGDTSYFFFCHPRGRNLTYPLPYGYSYTKEATTQNIAIDTGSSFTEIQLAFSPYQSIGLAVKKGRVEKIDFQFQPPLPQK